MLRIRTTLSIHTGSLILVNEAHAYRENLHGKELLGSAGIQLEAQAMHAWEQTIANTGAEGKIYLFSGYRPREEQGAIFRTCLAERGEDYTRTYVALPGHSEHQTGLALDAALTSGENDPITPSFPDSGISAAFRREAVRFGLIERYPSGKEEITGIGYEPWHFRFVGYPHSAIISRYALALEEYIEFVRQYPVGERWLHYGGYRIGFLREEELGLLPEDGNITLSGNNVDGYILTRLPA